MKIIKNYINGKEFGLSKEFLPVYDPSTGEIISNVILSNSKDVDKAILNSKESQIEWANVTPLKRSRILSKYKLLIEKNIDELSRLVSKEHGKTLKSMENTSTPMKTKNRRVDTPVL